MGGVAVQREVVYCVSSGRGNIDTYQFGNTGSSTCKVLLHGSNQFRSCPTSPQNAPGSSLAEAKARPYAASDAQLLQLRGAKRVPRSADACAGPRRCAADAVHTLLPSAQGCRRRTCLTWKCMALRLVSLKVKNVRAFLLLPRCFLQTSPGGGRPRGRGASDRDPERSPAGNANYELDVDDAGGALSHNGRCCTTRELVLVQAALRTEQKIFTQNMWQLFERCIKMLTLGGSASNLKSRLFLRNGYSIYGMSFIMPHKKKSLMFACEVLEAPFHHKYLFTSTSIKLSGSSGWNQ